jgi:hypothetical protein
MKKSYHIIQLLGLLIRPPGLQAEKSGWRTWNSGPSWSDTSVCHQQMVFPDPAITFIVCIALGRWYRSARSQKGNEVATPTY